MTGQVCLKEETYSDAARERAKENSRRGTALRSANYDEVAARGGEYYGLPVSRLDLWRAASQATPGLSDGARSLLNLYLTCLDTRKLADGVTSVWPGNGTAGRKLGKKDPTIRRLKGELEKAGYLIRKYDRRNRPLDGDAIDLAPFLAMVPSLLRSLDEDAAERKAAWEEQRKPDASTAHAEMSGDPLKNEPQNSTRKLFDSCLGSEGFEKDEADSLSTPSTPMPASMQAFREAKVINDALELSPRLKAAMDPEDEGISAQQAGERIWSVLPDLFPNDGANSMNHTFLWCAQRHGAQAFVFLAVALEDPTVKDARKMFGWFATHPEKIDLSRNLERIKHKPKPIEEKPQTLNKPGNAFENKIAEVIAAVIGVAKYNSWFAPHSIRFRESGGNMLIIEHESSVARNYIPNNMSAELRIAAENLGYDGYRVEEAR